MSTNPFLQNFKLQLVEISEKEKIVNTKDIHDGMVLKFQTVQNIYSVEKQTKVSVYDIPYIENILFKNDIKSNGRDLILFVVYNLVEDQDWINLKTDRVCSKMNISRPTLLSAIRQLEDAAILCRKSQSEYWVNPFYIFKGNRINLYQKTSPGNIEVVAKITK